MMTSVSGELGCGKTFIMSRELYRQSQRGCFCISNYNHVYSNLVIKNDPETLLEVIRQIAVLKQLGGELVDILPSFRHTGIFVAIDEAHLVFGRESKKSDMEEVILPFISLARKEDVHIWYVVQDPATIHKTFRRYTRDWIRLRPVIPIFRTKYVPHETRPAFRRERRLLFPWVWFETHHLSVENPVFNTKRRVVNEEGDTAWSEASTIAAPRSWVRNSDPFIHSMYDSNELSGVNIDPERKEEFDQLKKVHYIPHTMKKEMFPTFRKIANKIGFKWWQGPQIPKRYEVVGIELPQFDPSFRVAPKLHQKVERVEAADFLSWPSNPARLDRTTRKLVKSKSRQPKKSLSIPNIHFEKLVA